MYSQREEVFKFLDEQKDQRWYSMAIALQEKFNMSAERSHEWVRSYIAEKQC